LLIGGLDLAALVDYSALCIIQVNEQQQEDGICIVNAVKIWDHGGGYRKIIREMSDIYHAKGLKVLGVDESAVGGPVIEELKALGLYVNPCKFTNYSKDAMIQDVRLALEDKKLIIPRKGSGKLLEQIHGQERSVSQAGNTIYQHPSGGHDDLFWALCIAMYAAKPYRAAPRTGHIISGIKPLGEGIYSRKSWQIGR
jgi:hypothetical protein